MTTPPPSARISKGQCESLWWSARRNKNDSHWNECSVTVPYGSEVRVAGQERLLCSTHRAEVRRAEAAGLTGQLRWRTAVHA